MRASFWINYNSTSTTKNILNMLKDIRIVLLWQNLITVFDTWLMNLGSWLSKDDFSVANDFFNNLVFYLYLTFALEFN